MELTLSEIVKVIGAETSQFEDLKIQAVSTDSRVPAKDAIFFALKGERHDGHNFLWEAHKNGCVSAVVEYIPPSPPPIPLLKVDDTIRALGLLAGYYRDKFPVLCIGITGSTGKTTTKEMLAHILQAKHRVLKTEKNFNNEIGVPLTLFHLKKDHSALIVEMAMRGRGQIDWLTKIAKPQIGVITNIGPAHLEFFNSLEEIAQAKAELIQALPPNGTAVLNLDDQFFTFLRERTPCQVLSFGFSPKADVSCEVLDKEEYILLKIKTPKGNITAKSYLQGEHNFINLLAAIAASLPAELSLEEIEKQIPTLPLPPMRLEQIKLPGNILIINDSYNSNPLSLRAALNYLSEKKGRRIAILGDMLELGEESERLHREAGAWVKKAGVSHLILIGEKAKFIGDGAIEKGFPPSNIAYFPEKEGVVSFIQGLLEEGDTVLVKGSRKLQLEQIVEELKRCCIS
ncbi:UDP-N-acetylmuramoyl-tripeptide--D-alanyl-D-alanine ligase [bacterium]|nr:UDP-N-acetylmuramoyl-tripeptide--D-alanyl-D-alanine ligase [bacterium]